MGRKDKHNESETRKERKEAQKRVRAVLGPKPSKRQADKAFRESEKQTETERSRRFREVRGMPPGNAVQSHRHEDDA